MHRVELGELSGSITLAGRGAGRDNRKKGTRIEGDEYMRVCTHGDLWKRGSGGCKINKTNGAIANAKPKGSKE